MKKTTKIFGLLLTLFGLALVTGCTPITDTPYVPEETTYYTVTYSSEYGTAPASITVKENTVLTAEQLPELSTEGKTFGGWFDGDTKAEAEKYKVTKTVTLTAKWDVNTYTVTFNTNGGNSVESKTVTYGGKVEKPADPTKDTERYSFAYWYTSDKPDSAFDFDTPITSDITLYAKWTIKTYSITISSEIEHGTITVDKNPAAKDETITLTVNPETGYELATLTVTQGTTSVTVTDNTFTMPAGNVTVSASFKLIKYKVTYAAYTENGVNVQPEQTYDYFAPGESIELEVNIPDSENVAYVKYSGTMGNSDMTLEPELWFNGNCLVEFYYGTIWSSSSIKNLSDWNIRVPASEITIKNYFKLYEFEPEEDGEDIFYGVNSSRPGGREITVSSLKYYEEGILKIYF